MELFKLFGTIALNNSEANRGIDETSEKAKGAGEEVKNLADESEKTEGKMGKAFRKIGSAAVKVGATVAAGLAVAGTAVVALGKKAIEGYAEYEQLVGGVETLFKDSADTVIANSQKAYQTAGLSANEYMETVTSFSASLLQSLGGDTVAAAEKADQAIVDMSDNANKMGTSMESIQAAYQGFAKQNYTMLDNLKLGYGGTKEEMERLLEDATKLSGVEYDISSYADIVDAIHVVQTEMGITGTTAKEASKTISGSISAAKAAWKNLLVGMADDTQDLDALVDNFFESIVTVGDNILPRIGVVLNGITGLIQKLAPKIIKEIPGIVQKVLPSVVQGAKTLLTAIVKTLPELIKLITNTLPEIISAIQEVIKGIIDALPELIESIIDVIPTVLPQLISTVTDLIVYLAENLVDIIQPIIKTLPETIESIVDAIVNNLPILINGVISLVNGIVNQLPTIINKLVEALPRIITKITDGLIKCIPRLIEGLIELVNGIVDNLPTIIQGLVDAMPTVISSIIDAIISLLPVLIEGLIQLVIGIVNALPKIITSLIDALPTIIEAIVTGLVDNLPKLIEGCITLVVELVSHLPEIIASLIAAIPSIIESIIKAFGSIVTRFFDLGGDSGSNFLSGFADTAGDLLSFFGLTAPTIVAKIPDDYLGVDAVSGAAPKANSGVPKPGGSGGGVKRDFKTRQLMAEGGVATEETDVTVGDNGEEAIIPLKNNTGWINKVSKQIHDLMVKEPINAKSIADTGSSFVQTLQTEVSDRIKSLEGLVGRILDTLTQFFPELLEAFDVQLVFDDGTIVAEITPKIDRELRLIQKRKERG